MQQQIRGKEEESYCECTYFSVANFPMLENFNVKRQKKNNDNDENGLR